MVIQWQSEHSRLELGAPKGVFMSIDGPSNISPLHCYAHVRRKCEGCTYSQVRLGAP